MDRISSYTPAVKAFGPDQAPKNSVRDPLRREILLGTGVALAFLFLLLGWGMWARLDAGVIAPGELVVSGHRQTVQHRDGGIVSELDVQEGDRVRAGQVLLRLNADELRANERADAAEAIGLKALRARLLSELQGAPSIPFPAEFQSFTGADRADAVAAMALQRKEFSTRNGALDTEKGVLAKKEQESSEQITGYQRQVEANKTQQGLIQQEIGGLQGLYARGLVPATRMRTLERSSADLQGTAGAYNASIASISQEIGETRMRITDLEKERAADDAKELQQAEFQLADVEPKLVAVREQIGRTEVRAPATGRVVGLSVFTVGGVVGPGQKLMDIVPENEPLVIQAKVKPSDVSDVHMGLKTEIRVTGFHERTLPMLHGVVSKVSADSLTDEKTGASYFTIEVTVPPEERRIIRSNRGPERDLQPGLPVQVVIPLRKRSALGYITEPLSQMLWKSFRQP